MIRESYLPVLLVAVAVSAACSNAHDKPSARDASTPTSLTLVEDLRLDAEAEAFSEIRRVYVEPHSGNIVLPLPQEMRVLVYDSTGNRVATVGARGSGPGEFRHLGQIGWFGDTLFVLDSRLRRLSYVGSQGQVVRTQLLTAALGLTKLSNTKADTSFWNFNPVAVYGNGSMLGFAFLNLTGLGKSVDWGFVLIPAAGTPRLIARLPPYNDDRWWMTAAGFERPVPFAFQPQHVVAVDGSHFAFLTANQSSPEGGTFVVSLFRANGDTVFVRPYPYHGERIPGNVRDSAAAAEAGPKGTQTEGPANLGARFQALAHQRIPPFYSPVEHITLGLDSTVWITLRPTREGAITLILNLRGDPIGTVLTPPRSRIQQARRSHVWVTETDEYDLASVVRYRVDGWSTHNASSGRKAQR